MTPEFVTPEYIEACRQARYIQGWWAAVWSNEDVVDAWNEGRVSRGDLTPQWALPPRGTGLQTNVRVGDLFTDVNAQRLIGDLGVAVVGDVGGYKDWLFIHCAGFHLTSPDGLVFLPRLDQAYALAWLDNPGMHREKWSLTGGGWQCWELALMDLIPRASANLARLGCPAREV